MEFIVTRNTEYNHQMGREGPSGILEAYQAHPKEEH